MDYVMYTLVDGHCPPNDKRQWKHIMMIETEVGIAIKITLSMEVERNGYMPGTLIYFQENIKILPILNNKICNYVIWEMDRRAHLAHDNSFKKAFIQGFPLALNKVTKRINCFMSKLMFRVIPPDDNFTDKITDINIPDLIINGSDEPTNVHIQFQNYNNMYLSIMREYDKGKSSHMVELGVISKHPQMDCYYYHNKEVCVGTNYSDHDIMPTMNRKYGIDEGTVYLRTVCDAITEGLSKKEKTV